MKSYLFNLIPTMLLILVQRHISGKKTKFHDHLTFLTLRFQLLLLSTEFKFKTSQIGKSTPATELISVR